MVIPKEIRQSLGIKPGDEVVVEEDETGALVRRAPTVKSLRGMLAGGSGSGTAELEAERKRERDLEEAKARQWNAGRG